MTPFTDWQTFNEIVGSAAGALTGLQFVAMAIVSDVPRKSREQGIEAFTGPTIVHFVAALLLAASVAMPWQGIHPVAIFWVLGGCSGVVFVLITTLRMRRQKAYHPVFEDWLFHACLPCLAYAALAVAAISARRHLRGALFGIGAAELLLLIIGIHNSWDNLTYMVQMKRPHLEGD